MTALTPESIAEQHGTQPITPFDIIIIGALVQPGSASKQPIRPWAVPLDRTTVCHDGNQSL
jgi:hypothetical protein